MVMSVSAQRAPVSAGLSEEWRGGSAGPVGLQGGRRRGADGVAADRSGGDSAGRPGNLSGQVAQPFAACLRVSSKVIAF